MKKINIKIPIIIILIVIVVIIIASIILIKVNKENKRENTEKSNELLANANREEEEMVYLAYNIKETNTGKYDLDIKIPLLKIETDVTKKINSKIINFFGNKLKKIMNGEEYATYAVNYEAYNNNNIVSLIITAELKEGNTPKRKIIQTYNYDIQNDKLLNLEEIINIKNLDKTNIQNEILKNIETKNIQLEELKEQGYNVYIRNINSEEYVLENITTYFIGGDGKSHIIFAYGNNNYTTEVDEFVF